MVATLFRDETSDFRARRGRQAKRFEAHWQCGENIFAMADEVAADSVESPTG